MVYCTDRYKFARSHNLSLPLLRTQVLYHIFVMQVLPKSGKQIVQEKCLTVRFGGFSIEHAIWGNGGAGIF